MRPFIFHIGSKVLFGRNIVRDNSASFPLYGKKALLVTGRTSAKYCGALDDIEAALDKSGLKYAVFDRVENNPSLENVQEGGNAARDLGADMIIGVGGGSPLDAAKAVAVLAKNDIEPAELFSNVFSSKPLPIIAVPTTAGTGSEVTPYSILTRKDMQTKMSFGNEDTVPKLALLDPAYTDNLPRETTINTAVDAFSHAVEGYLGKKSTPMTDMLALETIRIFGSCLKPLKQNTVDKEVRERLLYTSLLGGMVIAHTGTTIMHGLGYSLTYFKQVPHGKANGLLMEEYFRFNYEEAREKIDTLIRLLGLGSIKEFGIVMGTLLRDRVVLTDAEISLYSSLAMQQKSTLNNIRNVEEKDLAGILKHACGDV
jgi:alcohol dehydrogenase class IV